MRYHLILPYHDAHIEAWQDHQRRQRTMTAPVEDVRLATNDPLVHAVLDWLTLPTNEPKVK